METPRTIKVQRQPPPPKQLETGWSSADSVEAPAAARHKLEVPSLLTLCVTAAALQKDGQNPEKSMDAQQQLWCSRAADCGRRAFRSLKADLIVAANR